MSRTLRSGKRGFFLFAAAALVAGGIVAVGCSDDTPEPGLGDASAPNDPAAALAAKLEADTGKKWIVDLDPALGTPDLLEPEDDPTPILGAGKTPEDAALGFLERYQSSFGTSAIRSELRHVETDVDPDGFTHVRFEQIVGPLAVFGEGLTLHFTPSGAIAFVNGRFVPGLAQKAQTAARSADEARSMAAGRYPGSTATDTTLGWDASLSAAPTLVYRVRVAGTAGQKPILADVFVDATRGGIVGDDDRIRTERATGKGVRAYAPINGADTKSFDVVPQGPAGTFALKSPRQNQSTVVEVTSLTSGALVTSTDLNAWDVLPTTQNGNGAAVDAFVHMGQVDAFYRSNFRWRSYDNRASNLRVIVHDNGAGDNNAYWNGSELHFGDGNAQTGGTDLVPTDLDTVAHELSHGVTEYTSGLVYGGESGALNESASDVFACLVEHQLHPNAERNLWFSEDSLVAGTPFRNMRHTRDSFSPQPNHVDEQEHKGVRAADWGPDNDRGGVHGNSGIPNNAFALMVEGGVQDTSRVVVPPGGWDLASRVAWFAQRYNDRPSTQFYSHARWQIAAAKKLRVAVEPVACAWVAVGVVKAEYAKSKYKVTCEIGCEAGTCDAGPDATPNDAGPTPNDAGDAQADVDARDTCVGRADGIYCSQIADFGAIICKGQAIAGGQQCPTPQKCVGPNGPGTTIQCR